MSDRNRKYQNARLPCQLRAVAWVDRLAAAVSSWRCVVCLEPALGMDLCSGCLEDLPWLGQSCRHCAQPLPADAALLCGACAQSDGLQDVDLCIAALAYEFPVDRLVTALKYLRKTEYARVLGELLAIRVHELTAVRDYVLPDFIVAVPLHPWRLLQRSFNQAAEIARWVAREHQLPVKTGLIRRARHTPGQAGLRRRARLANVQGAFTLHGSVLQRRIAVLDDVVTTGATTRELARVLKQAGAAEVQIWTVARAIA
jgi:ComF family protein